MQEEARGAREPGRGAVRAAAGARPLPDAAGGLPRPAGQPARRPGAQPSSAGRHSARLPRPADARQRREAERLRPAAGSGESLAAHLLHGQREGGRPLRHRRDEESRGEGRHRSDEG